MLVASERGKHGSNSFRQKLSSRHASSPVKMNSDEFQNKDKHASPDQS